MYSKTGVLSARVSKLDQDRICFLEQSLGLTKTGIVERAIKQMYCGLYNLKRIGKAIPGDYLLITSAGQDVGQVTVGSDPSQRMVIDGHYSYKETDKATGKRIEQRYKYFKVFVPDNVIIHVDRETSGPFSGSVDLTQITPYLPKNYL